VLVVVDFNNETTVTTPPGEIVKVVVLERREQVIEALESYYSLEGSDVDMQHKTTVLRARMLALWFQMQAMVRRRRKDAKGGNEDPTYDEIQERMLVAKEFEQILDCFEWMNEFIDDMGLTYIDSRARYDRRNIEDANQKKGL
jgi:hypothetical protein